MSIPQFDNSMPAVPRHPHDTNLDAAKRLYPKTAAYKHALVAHHLAAGDQGLTDFEAGALMGCLPTSAGATRIGMNKNQDHGITWFEKTNMRRISRPPAPNMAVVWRFTQEALQKLRES